MQTEKSIVMKIGKQIDMQKSIDRQINRQICALCNRYIVYTYRDLEFIVEIFD